MLGCLKMVKNWHQRLKMRAKMPDDWLTCRLKVESILNSVDQTDAGGCKREGKGLTWNSFK